MKAFTNTGVGAVGFAIDTGRSVAARHVCWKSGCAVAAGSDEDSAAAARTAE